MAWHKTQNAQLTTGRHDLVCTCNLIRTIVAAFDQNVRKQVADEPRRRVFRKRYDPVHTRQRGEHAHAVRQRVDGTRRPLSLIHI